jgi:hypothetical protein
LCNDVGGKVTINFRTHSRTKTKRFNTETVVTGELCTPSSIILEWSKKSQIIFVKIPSSHAKIVQLFARLQW